MHKNKRRILIVEDEFVNREILKNLLLDDYEILEAEDGEAALNVLENNSNSLSLILLDLFLPKISGLEVLNVIQAKYNHLPVIVLTSDKELEVQCLSYGASDFISKPYPDFSIIKARITRVIELFEDRQIIKSTERESLTRLYTKEYFYKYVADKDKNYAHEEFDAIAIGIRSFHVIQERFGSHFSDSLLVRFSKRLRSALQNVSGMVCHLEADTFIAYAKHFDDYEDFFKRISEDFYVDSDNRTPIKIQVGVYHNVDKNVDIDVRFERAKIALNKIRDSAVKNVFIFDDKLKEKEMFEEDLIEEFPTAIKEKQFVVYYQPKFNIRGDKPTLSSAEALIRWNHPVKGLISPGVFIPLFEEKGLIEQLDLYVWKEAAAQIRKWKEELGKYVPVSVNVSRVDLFDPTLVDTLINITKENGLANSDLLLEITESAATEEINIIIDKINELRMLGFKIEIDDFGTGYSSLSMINKIPLDALKIDMIFIRNAFTSQNDNQMIKIIIDIASYLKVPTIAEGVETIEQVAVLKTLGCDIVQGYYFSKPIPADEFKKFIIEKK
jgi:EAL domain-containing protein (putative c-di-GMP-specific phosphodiesterase class I)/FixJ family two-component response regulator